MTDATFIDLAQIEFDLSTLLTKEDYLLGDYVMFNVELDLGTFTISGMVVDKELVGEQNLYFIDLIEDYEELKNVLYDYGSQRYSVKYN
ncbi:MAG: hypothetical protein AVO33_05340 [delta proteobacterium ML8_F1]|nr:MAG: hypothetical protein AVO33_05340 [delta proteobacterium ML8_F1]